MWKRMVHGQLGGCENLQQGPRLPAASKTQSFMVGGEGTAGSVYSLEAGRVLALKN